MVKFKKILDLEGEKIYQVGSTYNSFPDVDKRVIDNETNNWKKHHQARERLRQKLILKRLEKYKELRKKEIQQNINIYKLIKAVIVLQKRWRAYRHQK